MKAKIRALLERNAKRLSKPKAIRKPRGMGWRQTHDDAFYEQKLQELAPYWQEHLWADDKLLEQVIDAINSVDAPSQRRKYRSSLW